MITPVLPGQGLPTNTIAPMPGSATPPALPAVTPIQPAVPVSNPNQALINSLSSFVRKQWEAAKNERVASGIEDRMIRSKQAMNLEYDAKKRTEIAQMMGANYEPPYMPVIQTKCRAAAAWITEVYFQPGARPFGIENTPDPQVPPDVEEAVKTLYAQQIVEDVLARYDQQITAGTVDHIDLDSEIKQALETKVDQIHRQIMAAAKEMTAKFEVIVDDRLTEGGWYQGMKELIYDFVSMPKAFLKGPEIRTTLERGRTFSNGKWMTTYEHKQKEKYERVSPVNIYPLVGTRTCNDGLIERVQYTPMELQAMLGVPGFDDAEIRAVLQEAEGNGLREWTAIDTRIATLDNKTTNSVYLGDNIDGLIYWGQAPGKHLIEWGLKESMVPDRDKWYKIYCILIGSHVIMARLNPNPDGSVPYYGASLIEDTDKFWNMALPDILWSHQVTANAVFRACGYNAGIASGPVIEQDIERCPDQSALYPGKRFFSTNQQMSTGRAINLYNIPLLVAPLSQFYDFLMTLADFDSGVPRIAHGGSTPGGVTDTASGTSMFLSQSARSIKDAISRIDSGITEPSVRTQAFYIIDNDPDTKVPFGDLNFVAKGATALIVKEQSTIRLKEMLAETNNPIDLQLIGEAGRREMLRGAMKSLPLDVDKILPDEADMINQVAGPGAIPRQLPAPGQPEPGAAAEPQGSEATMLSGELASGQEHSLFEGA